MDNRGPHVAVHLFHGVLLEQGRAANHAHGFINHLNAGFHHKLKTRDQIDEVFLGAHVDVVMGGNGLMQHGARRTQTDFHVRGQELIARIVGHGLVKRLLGASGNPVHRVIARRLGQTDITRRAGGHPPRGGNVGNSIPALGRS